MIRKSMPRIRYGVESGSPGANKRGKCVCPEIMLKHMDFKHMDFKHMG